MAASRADLTGAILAGGFGTRLRSRVADRPKVLAPVHGRPYLTYLLDQMASAGLREVVLLTGYMADMVQTTLGDTYQGMRIVCSPEPAPLGTGGALRLALPLISTPAVLLLNGDSYCDVPLPALWDAHCRQRAVGQAALPVRLTGRDRQGCLSYGERAAVSLTLCEVPDTARFGRVHLAGDRVVRFEEKHNAAGAGWINAGVYIMDRDAIDEIPSGRPVSLERDMFPAWASHGRVHGFRCTGRFLDIGTPESYAEAETFFRAA